MTYNIGDTVWCPYGWAVVIAKTDSKIFRYRYEVRLIDAVESAKQITAYILASNPSEYGNRREELISGVTSCN